jgi:hypothetical protein
VPFTAQCPNCRGAKFRVPWKKHESRMACPKCETVFALVPDDEPPSRSRTLGRSYDTTVTSAVESLPRPMTVAAQDDNDPPEPKGLDLPLALALVSLSAVGLTVVAGQFPYGRFVAMGLAPVGLLFAAFSLFGLERRRPIAWAGVAANAVVGLLLLLAPGWLGAGDWLPPADPNEGQNRVLAVGKDGGVPLPAEWVDASAAAWQQADVRVDVTAVRVGTRDAKATSADQRKVKALRVTLKVTNSGVARPLECKSATEPPSELKLTTAAGTVIKPFAGEKDVKPTTLFPGKQAEITFGFEPPADAGSDLKLEIPAAWFGSQEPVRLRIPASMIQRR